jgi:hypothetical protein
VPRPDTGTKTKLGPGTAVDLTGGTNSTEERKTGKKATQYSPRTTQKKQPLQLNCTEPQQDKSAADNTGRELRTHAQTKNQISDRAIPKSAQHSEKQRNDFSIQAQKGLHLIYRGHRTPSLI